MSESKDAAIEYFKILQNTINRMANNSFLLKGWIVTIFAAIVVLVGGTSPWVWLSAIFAIVLFWFLDSYYLRQERLFRKIWENQTKNFREEQTVDLFNMDTTSVKSAVRCIPKTMFSVSEAPFYLVLVIISIILGIVSIP